MLWPSYLVKLVPVLKACENCAASFGVALTKMVAKEFSSSSSAPLRPERRSRLSLFCLILLFLRQYIPWMHCVRPGPTQVEATWWNKWNPEQVMRLTEAKSSNTMESLYKEVWKGNRNRSSTRRSQGDEEANWDMVEVWKWNSISNRITSDYSRVPLSVLLLSARSVIRGQQW